MISYFYDTYALIEILNNNINYKKYVNCEVKLSCLNLYELYKKLLFDGLSKFEAEKYLLLFADKQVLITYEDIINATELKLQNPVLAIPDCFGYVIAKRLKIKFLTGDKEFKDMNNVEFVQ